MRDLSKLREQLNICDANGIDLDADERAVLKLLRQIDSVSDGWNARAERIEAARARATAANYERERARHRTFPGTRQADDDLVLVSRLHPERCRVTYPHGETLWQFSDGRSVHYVPAAVHAAMTHNQRREYSFHDSPPDDLMRHVGGADRFLGFTRNRDGNGLTIPPDDNQITAATQKALEACRELVDGCSDAALLRVWQGNAGSAGDAAGVLRAVIERRLQALEGTAPPPPSSPPPKTYCHTPPAGFIPARTGRAATGGA